MREIKFRGRRVDTGQWVYGYYMRRYQILEGEVRDAIVAEQPGDDGGMYIVDPKTVGQYTGLKDKNGVEIYEGDVIRARHQDGNLDTGSVVYGSKGSFCLRLNVGMVIKTPLLNYITGLMFPEYDFEVIGNIYENPELVKEAA